jgi:signal transduction histidine kinase
MNIHDLKRLKLDATSVRLSLTYLSIIMVLVVSFSIFFYHASTENFNALTIQASGASPVTARATKTSGIGPVIGARSFGADSTSSSAQAILAPTLAPATAMTLNKQLSQQVEIVRMGLIRYLLLLNAVALIGGALFSYYLARRSLKPMEEAMDAQTRFASDASHELRTPLTAIIARNEVALRKPKLTLSEAKQVMKNNIDQAVKLEHLSDGLLRLSRGDNKHLKRQVISLADITTEAINRVIAPAQAKGIKLNDSVNDTKVYGDLDSLVQIVAILLDNAIKYSDHGKTIYMDGGSEGRYAMLSIRDEGPGIRATDLPHIFDRFFRADYSRAKQGEHGYGLGLSIAKKLTEQNRGKLTAESVLDEGSTFTLYMPLAKL